MSLLEKLKNPWWKSNYFLSSLFGSFLSTVYVFALFTSTDKLKYSGVIDFINQLLPSVMPIWITVFVITLILFALLNKKIDGIVQYMGFAEKSYVGFGTLIYVLCAMIIFGVTRIFSLGAFNSFAVISTITIGVIFANSMNYVLSNLSEMKG